LRNKHYKRLHSKALGFEPNKSYPIKRRLAKWIRWISEPKDLFMRVLEKLGFLPDFPEEYQNWLQLDGKRQNKCGHLKEHTS
jgi:hypothetical protein